MTWAVRGDGRRYTPGQIQPLLNQALIPLTMACAFCFLKSRYNAWELVGAALMLAGAAVSIVPDLLGTGDENSKWWVRMLMRAACGDHSCVCIVVVVVVVVVVTTSSVVCWFVGRVVVA